MSLSTEAAEARALSVLAWLVNNDDLRDVFMGATGASAQDMRERAGEPEFLGSVLDFLLMDDAWIVSYCDSESLPYEHIKMARSALPGGAETHWT